MSTPNAPVLGFTYPAPRTWSPGDFHTAARWRADMTNLGYLYAGKARPMLLSYNNDHQSLSSGSNTLMYIGPNVPVNTWAVVVQNQNTPSNNPQYQIPFAGYYLLEAALTFTTAGTPANSRYAVGFQNVVNGAGAANQDGGASPAINTTAQLTSAAGAELIEFNTYANTSDTTAMYAFTNNGSPGTARTAAFMVEWVGLPSSGLTGFTGSYGVKVTNPQAVAAPPSGQGTTLTAAVAVGATTIDVADVTGIVTGATIGLDYLNGAPYTNEAETVTVTSTASSGTGVIGISAALYPHSNGDPVAVPLSAAFMNQQLRDVVNFMSFPPLVRAASNTTQSLQSQTFPAGTQITTLGNNNIDTFGAFTSNAFTAPVAGTYLCYGQVYLAGSTSSFNAAAGLSVNSGTIQWGERFGSTSSSAQHVAPTVRRLLRLNSGDVVTLYGTQDSGSSMNTFSTSPSFSKMIVVWRSF